MALMGWTGAVAREEVMGKAKTQSAKAKRSAAVVRAVALRLGLVQALLRAGAPVSVMVTATGLAVMELAVQAAEAARLAAGAPRMMSSL